MRCLCCGKEILAEASAEEKKTGGMKGVSENFSERRAFR